MKRSAENAKSFKGGRGNAPPGNLGFQGIQNAISSILGKVLSDILGKYQVINSTILLEK